MTLSLDLNVFVTILETKKVYSPLVVRLEGIRVREAIPGGDVCRLI